MIGEMVLLKGMCVSKYVGFLLGLVVRICLGDKDIASMLCHFLLGQ